jgi:hypothetical protein
MMNDESDEEQQQYTSRTPGEVIGREVDFVAGKGTYSWHHKVVASVFGLQHIIPPSPDAADQVSRYFLTTTSQHTQEFSTKPNFWRERVCTCQERVLHTNIFLVRVFGYLCIVCLSTHISFSLEGLCCTCGEFVSSHTHRDRYVKEFLLGKLPFAFLVCI